ncbi:PKD-like family lipoprotein [Pedobacter africanus]|nr:PKD-like family lipoprotein [Pedobacter africanus]
MKFLNKMILMFLVGGLFQACKKDPGNYNYIEINEAVVSGLDSLYSVNQGEILQIKPKIAYSRDAAGDTLNYKYSWLRINREGYNAGVPKLIDSATNFNVRMNDNLGVYNYSFRITDKKTGVWKESYFKIFVTNKTYEGWYLLSETGGKQSRLDMLSYKVAAKKYEFMEDVLAASRSTLKLKGTPSFIEFFNTNGVPIINGTQDALVVGTTEMATFLGVDTLEHLPIYDFSVFMEGNKNLAIGPGSKMETLPFNVFLWANHIVYTQYYGKLFPINKMSSGNTNPFKTSRSFGAASVDAVLFNEDASEFVWYPGNGAKSCIKIENETLFKNKIDKDLLYMKYSSYNGGEYFAILKDKTSDKVYLARFTVGKQNYFAEITGTPIAQAEQFEVSGDFGYVFYSVGGKLYEYDFNLKLNKEMADYGSRKISLLKFQYVDPGYYTKNPRYVDINRRLCVCTYDEGNIDRSGTLDLYFIPPINGQLVKEESFSGMGKIVSITYRNRS